MRGNNVQVSIRLFKMHTVANGAKNEGIPEP